MRPWHALTLALGAVGAACAAAHADVEIQSHVISLSTQQIPLNHTVETNNTADSFPLACQTDCAYAVTVFDACNRNDTAACLGVCASPNLNSLIVCINCVYRETPNVTYAEWQSAYANISLIEGICKNSGRQVDPTEPWEQWPKTSSLADASSSSASSASDPATSSASASASAAATAARAESSTLIGAIAGGTAAGVLALAGLLALLIFLLRRRKRLSQNGASRGDPWNGAPEPKFDVVVDPAISPYVTQPSASSSTSPLAAAAAAAAHQHEAPLENPHLPPGAAAAGGKVQYTPRDTGDVAYRRHVDSVAAASSSAGEQMVIDLPPEYQNARG